ncbi:ATPase [Enterobacter roggenkampii]|uniref:ATPase n=1 Tax=Enterobacter roggenkampii TaxID=1812935 RepID=A0A837L9I8_9ENTR|nr:ATPase [Enterobacter roggenkampii]KHO34140.1 ATPase [Enterobacter sp. FB]KLR23934.1 ATPase [Enterobacter bugandensis]KSX58892.1 ATPase [Enterobacter sp. 50588862]OFU72707.1 ATPase [Enterobacter sp. HMSC16D10]
MGFAIFILFLHPPFSFLRNLCAINPTVSTTTKVTRRWIVSAGLIAGIVLVFLLLGYLVYALINAEAF